MDEQARGSAESPDPGTEEKEVRAWEGAIGRTQQWRDKLADKAGWKRFIKEYKGDWDFQQQNLSIPLVPINKVFSWVKAETARLYFSNPWITVNPKRVEDVGSSQIAEQVLNYLWLDMDLKRQIKSGALLDGLIVGHGWIKVGYSATFGINESAEPTRRGPGRPRKDLPVESNEFIKSENVFAVHYKWDDVLFDPSATWPSHHNARWIAYKWTKPYRAIKESRLYKNVDALRPSETPTKAGDSPVGKDVKVVTGWEIWDKDHEKVLTIVPGHKSYLREIAWPDEFRDRDGVPEHCGVMLGFNPIPGEPYPLSDIAPQEALLIEKIKARSIQLNHLKRWNRQIFIKPDLMTEENKTNFKQGVDGAIIEVQGDPAKDFYIPPYAPVQQDIYGVENAIDNDLREVSGQSEAERGAPARTGTRTLGELRMVLQGNHARAEERLDVLEDFIAEVARKILQVIQKKFDLPKITRIVGNKALSKAALMNRSSAKPMPGMTAPPEQAFTSDFSFSWTKEDIRGEMDVDVLAGSTVPLNKENKLQMLEKIIPLLPAAGITPGSPAARAFAREVFRGIDIKALEPIMDMADEAATQNPSAQNPMAIKAQMEMQKAQMKMQQDAAKAKLQQQAQAAKTEAQLAKSKADIAKVQMSMNHDVLKSILEQYSNGTETPDQQYE